MYESYFFLNTNPFMILQLLPTSVLEACAHQQHMNFEQIWARWIPNSLGIHMSYETGTQLRLATFSSRINVGVLHSNYKGNETLNSRKYDDVTTWDMKRNTWATLGNAPSPSSDSEQDPRRASFGFCIFHRRYIDLYVMPETQTPAGCKVFTTPLPLILTTVACLCGFFWCETPARVFSARLSPQECGALIS